MGAVPLLTREGELALASFFITETYSRRGMAASGFGEIGGFGKSPAAFLMTAQGELITAREDPEKSIRARSMPVAIINERWLAATGPAPIP